MTKNEIENDCTDMMRSAKPLSTSRVAQNYEKVELNKAIAEGVAKALCETDSRKMRILIEYLLAGKHMREKIARKHNMSTNELSILKTRMVPVLRSYLIRSIRNMDEDDYTSRGDAEI